VTKSVVLTASNVAAALGGSDAVLLGSGTYGQTWRVVGVDLGDGPVVVAAKFLRPEHFNTTLAERETGWLRKMDSAGVVRLLDVATVEVEEVEHTVLFCEFIDGGSVADNVVSQPPSVADVIAFAAALLASVEHVHEAGAVHRDIKPANILLRHGRWDSPVLIDFGLVKGAGDLTITRYPQQMGSLWWMSPEQLRGERARNSSDMWACGVVLFELLCGDHPFLDLDEINRVGAQADEIAELLEGPPRAFPASVPEALQAAVTKLLAQEGWARGSARVATETFKGMA
jgi:eukaryotic-like serine/threonine-protein kinase